MLETRKAHELDIVEVTEDLPEYSVKRGERGTVVEIFDDPEEAYMVEFVDESGTSSRLADWVKPHQMRTIDTGRKFKQAMQQRSWHSVKQDVHHTNSKCNTASKIELEDLQEGTGGKPLCQECANLDKAA